MTSFPPIHPIAARTGGGRFKSFSGAPVRVGFVPLNDCAPLVAAQARGDFDRQGVQVRLSRELGWATIRDKLAQGELDAAHAPCGFPLILAAGHTCVPTATVVGLVLNLEGNAITLSRSLAEAGVRDATTLRSHILAVRSRKTLTFGTVSSHSSHTYLLRTWLNSAGPGLDQEVRIVVVPPPQMLANLVAGHLDGFCSGEPWNSLAVADGYGWIAATSGSIAPRHPEKVLVARSDFAARRPQEHLALLAALLDSCAWCSRAGNHAELALLLADRRHVGLSPDIIQRGLSGPLERGLGFPAVPGGLSLFFGPGVNEPTAQTAAWIAGHLVGSEVRDRFSQARLGQIFRSDCHRQALALSAQPHPPIERESLPLPA